MSSIPQDPLADPRQQINPWLLVLGTTFAAGLLGVAALFVAAWMAPKSRADAAEHLMPDGTILRIEGITIGQHHRQLVESAPRSSIFFWERSRHFVAHSTSANQIVVWMSRRDAGTGKRLDFDWWLNSECETSAGERIADRDPCLHQLGHGSSSTQGDRPLRADHRFQSWLVGSGFPKFRTRDGRFKLHVKNTKNETVATIDLTLPAGVDAPVWTPDPLPATKSNGDLSVTLLGLTVHSSPWTHNGQPKISWSVYPVLKMLSGGEPTTDWKGQSWEFSDPFGNVGHGHDEMLSTREPAWKLRFTLFREPNGTFDVSETHVFKAMPLPAVDAIAHRTDEAKFPGQTVRVIALGGVGGSAKLSYPLPAGTFPTGMTSSRGSSGQAFERPYRTEFKSDYNSARVAIESGFPHVLIHAGGLAARHRVYVTARDDQDREVPTHPVYVSGSELMAHFLKTEPDAKSVDLTVICHTGREFEFFVAPPAELLTKEPASP